jgi:hypothetical protein
MSRGDSSNPFLNCPNDGLLLGFFVYTTGNLMAKLTAVVRKQHHDWAHIDMDIMLDGIVVRSVRVNRDSIDPVDIDSMTDTMVRLVGHYVASGDTIQKINAMLPQVDL